MRVFVESHGCRLNQADGDGLEALVRAEGIEVAERADGADVVVVNTCTITHRAGADARRRVRSLARAGKRIIVTGCHANAAPEELAGLPGVIAVLGNEHKAELAALAAGDEALPGRLGLTGAATGSTRSSPLIAADRLWRRRAAPTLPLNVTPTRSRAYLKVQDGCNYRCSFCIVPGVRGRSQSTELAEVRRRASALDRAGVPEIVLTGVHLGTYGWDLGLRPGLVPLIETVLEAAPAARVRLGSIDPHEVGEDLIELMAGESRVCRQLHLPIQSGDDGVLERMRRAHRVEDLERLVPEIRRRLPDASVGSDIIVGHPGEDTAAFQRTCELAGRRLDYAHVFTFSPRPGTAAAVMDGQIPPGERQRRNTALRAITDENWRQFTAGLVGRSTDVVIHRRQHGSGAVLGTTGHGVRVRFGLEAHDDPARWLGRRLRVHLRDVDRSEGPAALVADPLI